MQRSRLLIGLLILCLPQIAFARLNRAYDYNGVQYHFEIDAPEQYETAGDFQVRLTRVNMKNDPNFNIRDQVQNLPTPLKVEISADGEQEVMQLKKKGNSRFGVQFIPSFAGTYTYRVHGKLEGKNVDFSFDCSGKGEQFTAADISSNADGKQKLLHTDGFVRCPKKQEIARFPNRGGEQQVAEIEKSIEGMKQFFGIQINELKQADSSANIQQLALWAVATLNILGLGGLGYLIWKELY